MAKDSFEQGRENPFAYVRLKNVCELWSLRLGRIVGSLKQTEPLSQPVGFCQGHSRLWNTIKITFDAHSTSRGEQFGLVSVHTHRSLHYITL